MFNIKLSTEAEYEYHEIGKYIAQDNLYYAKEVLDKIDKSIETIFIFPFIGEEISLGIRRIVEPKYKFKIVYEVKGKIIYIISIFKYKNIWE